MSRTAWPRWCTIAEASRLFAEEGVTVHRSNLSRYIDSRKIEKVDGKVDPNKLFDAYSRDYGRKIMAGATAQPAPPAQQARAAPQAPLFAPSAGQSAPADTASDPSRDLKELQARKLRLELAEQEGHIHAAEDVAASLAMALATMRAKFAQTARDEAARLLADLGLPGHMHAKAVACLKRYANLAQEAWADTATEVLTPSTPAGITARQRRDALMAYDLELRGLSEQDADLASAPAEPEPGSPVVSG